MVSNFESTGALNQRLQPTSSPERLRAARRVLLEAATLSLGEPQQAQTSLAQNESLVCATFLLDTAAAKDQQVTIVALARRLSRDS